MKGKKSFFIIFVLFIVLMSGAAVLYKNLSAKVQNEAIASEEIVEQEEAEFDEEEEDVQVEKVPDFTVYDNDGNEVKLSDFEGKAVVLNFWASWCGSCKSEMPDFQELYEQYGEDINFVMVNMTDGGRETLEHAKKFIEKQGYTFPVYFDTEYDAATVYGVRTIPTTYFIDKDGYGQAMGRGMLSKEMIEEGIGYIYE